MESVLYSGGMEQKHRVRTPRLRACCENSSKFYSPRSESPDPRFLIASPLRIAESEGIQGLNSNRVLASLLLSLIQLLGIRYFCFEICRRSCVTVSFWFPLGIGVIGEVGSKLRVQPSQQWHWDRINIFRFVCLGQIVQQKIYWAVESNN